MAGLDANTKLFLGFDGTDGDTTTTDGVGRHSGITFYGSAQLDDGIKKFGTTSLQLNGTTDWIDMPYTSDFDLFDNNTDTKLIEFWVQHASVGGDQTYMCQWEDDNNYWVVRHRGATGTLLLMRVGGVAVINSGYLAGHITDTSMHHWLLAKVADVYAIYVDGTQKTYYQDTSTGTNTGRFNISSFHGLSRFVHGNIDEFRWHNQNYFSLSPVVGLTDSFTPPTTKYTTLPRTTGVVLA